MRSFYLTISFLLILTKSAYSQEDSLSFPSEKNEVAIPRTDSVLTVISYNDSSSWRYREPFPGCIVPLKIDTFHWGKFVGFDPSVFSYIFSSRYNKAGALQDIKKHDMQILFSGGFGGMPDFSSAEDQLFQKRYGVNLHSQGCLHYGTGENEAEYNQTIFDYLDKTYGVKWRYELRSDAIGFEAPPEVPGIKDKELSTSASLLVIGNNTTPGKKPMNHSDPEDSIWWYVMPTSGFALLLALYFVKRRKK
ncbi:hypothetical protein [Fluviicola sp.]|uniref:FEKKY domain-containing protein n=1 Tax=Fluviicola sp. TaxID=1917219 RepID=UPI00261CA175|nr:hypothetical protein [Fluviicola sp.]